MHPGIAILICNFWRIPWTVLDRYSSPLVRRDESSFAADLSALAILSLRGMLTFPDEL